MEGFELEEDDDDVGEIGMTISMGGMDGPPGIEQMMQLAMQSMMMGGPPGMGGGAVRITTTTDADGKVTIRQQVISEPSLMIDDDDEDEMPPEIRALLELTDNMHSKATGSTKKIDRVEESHEDIMKRMHSISEEIGERHDQSKYQLSNTGKERLV